MKFTVIFCLINSAVALRFLDDRAELNSNEEDKLVRPTLVEENAIPNSNESRRLTFSQGLKRIQNDKLDWDTVFRAEDERDEFRVNNQRVIQPSEESLTKREKMALIK